jgi:hypothetical protein
MKITKKSVFTGVIAFFFCCCRFDFGGTPDCEVLPCGLQHKFPRRDVVRILQSEEETLLTAIRFPAVVLIPAALPVPHGRFPLQQSEAPEAVLLRVENHS